MRLNIFLIKIIAIICMTFDHIGVFFPDLAISLSFRIIGRLAFPLFAFCIAEGFRHSHNNLKYLARLLAFALAIEAAMYFIDPSQPKNVFFTLSFGLLALMCTKRKVTWPLIIPIIVLAYFLNADYDYYGVIVILIFGLFRNKILSLSLFSIVNIVYSLWGYEFVNYVQLFAIASGIIIAYYNGKKGPSMKYFFYLYYPGHIAILFAIQHLITYLSVL